MHRISWNWFWVKNIEFFFPGLLLLTSRHSLTMARTQQKDSQQSTPLSTWIKVEGWWGKIEPGGSSQMSVHLTILYNPKIIASIIYRHVVLGEGREASFKPWTVPSHFHSRGPKGIATLQIYITKNVERKRVRHKFATLCWPCIYDE